MTPSTELDPMATAYRQAERMIDQAIANMEGETHIEYNSSIERDSKPRLGIRLKRWVNKLLIKR